MLLKALVSLPFSLGKIMISQRAQKIIQSPSKIVKAHFTCAENPFGPDNPTGHLNFGTAENFLLDSIVLKKIQTFQYTETQYNHYKELFGTERLRRSFTNFLEYFFTEIPLSFQNVVVASGATAIIEMLAYALFDRGDKILIPAPYYLGFDFDFTPRFGVEIVPFQMEDDSFYSCEKFLTEIASGQYKAIMINNPHNPTGLLFDKSFLQKIVQTCKQANIHLISDEAYIHSPIQSTEFYSLLNELNEYDNIHLIYTMAKDFALSGFKCGFFYSHHQLAVSAMKQLAYFSPVSNYTQLVVDHLLKDLTWVEQLIIRNRRELSASFGLLSPQLASMDVNLTAPQRGIFCYPNFSALASSLQIKDELALYDYFFDQLRINILPGSAFSDKRAMNFRICFARPEADVKEFLRRLKFGKI